MTNTYYPAVPTTLAPLLQAAAACIVSANIIASTNIFIATEPEITLRFPPTDIYAVISPGRQRVNQSVREGAGRVVMLMEGRFDITLWVRLILDQTPRDDYWITDSTLGVLHTMNSIVNALELFQPNDGAGNALSATGYELVEISSYKRSYPRRPDDSPIGWGNLTSQWQVEWQYALNPQTAL